MEAGMKQDDFFHITGAPRPSIEILVYEESDCYRALLGGGWIVGTAKTRAEAIAKVIAAYRKVGEDIHRGEEIEQCPH